MKKTFHATSRKAWREWLESHFQTEKDIWLMFPKKASGIDSVSYNDAVEEAICFGWIDSTLCAYNEDFSIQRFTPRNPKSKFSQLNIERVVWLNEHNLIHPSVIDSVKHLLEHKYIFPEDIMQKLQKDPVVWENYNKFSESYKRIRIAYIDIAREYPEHFEKRLKYFIKKTREGKHVNTQRGTEKYY